MPGGSDGRGAAGPSEPGDRPAPSGPGGWIGASSGCATRMWLHGEVLVAWPWSRMSPTTPVCAVTNR